MHVRTFLALASLLVALAAPHSSRAAIVEGYVSLGSESVVAGVVHDWGTTQTDNALQRVNLIRVANRAPGVQFETGLPSDRVNARNRITDQAAAATFSGHKVVGAVNGDFWAAGPLGYAPVGLNVRNGELVTANGNGRAALGFTANGTALIGTPLSVVELTLPDTTVAPIARINQLRRADEAVLYTPRFGDKTATDSTGVEIVLSGVALPLALTGTYSANVDAVYPGTGNSTIGAGNLVLSSTGAAATALAGLQVGDQVGLSISITAGWAGVVNAVGGSPVLVHNGAYAGPFTDPKGTTPHPRTAVGLDSDGSLFLATFDGESASSGGLVLDDLAELMLSLGAVEAINLDGGGSTTMAVDPEGAAGLAVVSHPSHAHERRVNTSLQVVSAPADDGLPTTTPPIVRLEAGVAAGKTDTAAEITWSGSDSNGQIVRSELQRLAGDGTWRDVPLADPSAQSAGRRLVFGRRNQFRVRVTDNDGNVSPWVAGPTYRVVAYNERNAELLMEGHWLVNSKQNAIGGHYARSSIRAGSGTQVRLAFSGVQVGWVAQTESRGGMANVFISGAPVASVDMHSANTRPRMVMFVSAPAPGPIGAPPAERTIEVQNVSSLARPIVNLDAFLVLVAE